MAYWATACGRDVKPMEVSVWYDALHHVPKRVLDKAVRVGLEKDGYKDLGTVLSIVKDIKAQNIRYVNGAKARGLVPRDWPEDAFLPDDVYDAVVEKRREMYAATNDTPDAIQAAAREPMKALDMGVILKGADQA